MDQVRPEPANKEDKFSRAMLVKFLQLGIGKEMSFFCMRGDGEKIIQRMRVRLSKLRKRAKAARKVVQEFKMIVRNVEETTFPIDFAAEKFRGMPADKVLLYKQDSKIGDLSRALNAIDDDFSAIVVGNKVMVAE